MEAISKIFALLSSKNHKIIHKLWVIIGVFSSVLLFILVLSSLCMLLLSDVRATISGKSVWASSHREAVFRLTRYLYFNQQEDFRAFNDNLAIPTADRLAFHSILSNSFDIEIAVDGFRKNGLHPAEARRISYIFRWLQNAPYVKDAINAWSIADEQIQSLYQIAESARSKPTLNFESRRRLIDQLTDATSIIYLQEKRFDRVLAEGSRFLTGMLMGLVAVLGLVLVLLGGMVSSRIAKNITADINALKLATSRLAEGKFRMAFESTRKDEVGELARAFKKMALQREKAEQLLASKANELSMTNKKLVESEKLKDEFLATISHELRTPLTLIISPLESLIEQEESSTTNRSNKELYETMHNNSIRLLQMVSALLDFSKFQAKKMEARRVPVDIDSLIKSLVKEFQVQAENKNISLEHELDASGMILMDRYFFERIVFNLVSNAIKFTPAGGLITVRLHRNSNQLVLAVEDSGIGISARDQLTIFEKFKQVEGATTRNFEGTGLGLALVKRFAEALGGNVEVNSSLGNGTTFLVRCFAPTAPNTPKKTETFTDLRLVQKYQGIKATTSQSDNIASGENPKIVIAEDNQELASYIELQLHKIARIKIVSNGEEALEIAKVWQPDLILSDVMMPRMDGFTLCKKIKSEKATKSIPVILLTALNHRKALLKGWEAGADEYLFKPFHPTELVTRVKSILSATQERMRAQIKLKEANENLEHSVKERTLALQKANENLAKLNTDLDHFAHIAAHDLREPVRRLTMLSEELNLDFANEVPKEVLVLSQKIHQQSKFLMGLIKDFRLLSGVATGTQAARMDFSIIKLAQEAVEPFYGEFVKRGIKIQWPIKKHSITVNGYKSLVGILLRNLFENILKYGKESSTVVINLTQTENTIITSISNRIDENIVFPDPLDDLFLPFSKGIESASSGLGLSISKRVIDRHQGKIWVDIETDVFSINFTLNASA